MMTALAKVVVVERIPHGYRVELSCDQQTSCSHCQSQQSCGTGIVSKAIGNKQHLWQLTSETEVRVGQLVEIGLPEKKLFQFAALVYLLPLSMLMLGAAIGEWLISPLFSIGEGATILASVGALLLGIGIARHFSSRLQDRSKQSVTLIRVLGEEIPLGDSF